MVAISIGVMGYGVCSTWIFSQRGNINGLPPSPLDFRTHLCVNYVKIEVGEGGERETLALVRTPGFGRNFFLNRCLL